MRLFVLHLLTGLARPGKLFEKRLGALISAMDGRVHSATQVDGYSSCDVRPNRTEAAHRWRFGRSLTKTGEPPSKVLI